MSTDTINSKPIVDARLGGVRPFGAELFGVIPDEVRQASERFEAAEAARHEAHAALKVARADVQAAEREDARQAEQAVLDGQALPKATATNKSKAALADAEREVDARTRAATTLQNQYLAETIAALDAIRGAAHARLATLGTDTVAALDQLEAALVENLAIGRLLDELREDGAWLGSRSAVFSPSLPSGRDPLKATPLRKLLDQLRATLSTEEAGR